MGEDRAGVSVAEAAAALGITPEAVRKRLARGTLPGHRVGRTWRVHLDSVDGPGGHTTRAGGQSQQGASATMTALQAEVRHLQAMLDTVTAERDYLRQAHAAALRALPAGTEQAMATSETSTSKPRASWWQRLWGRD